MDPSVLLIVRFAVGADRWAARFVVGTNQKRQCPRQVGLLGDAETLVRLPSGGLLHVDTGSGQSDRPGPLPVGLAVGGTPRRGATRTATGAFSQTAAHQKSPLMPELSLGLSSKSWTSSMKSPQ